MGLKEARSTAEDNRRLLAAKKEPLQERHAEAVTELVEAPLSFMDVARDWENQFLDEMHSATIKKKKMQLNCHVYPVLGDLPIKEIGPMDILERVLRPIQAKGMLETAHRAKLLCSQIFRFAVATGKADRDPTHDLRGAMPSPKVKHRSTILEPAQIAKLLRDIHNYS